MSNKKTPPATLLKLNNALNSEKFRIFDFFSGLALLAYGIYAESTLFISVGVLSLILSYFQPVKKFQNRLMNKTAKNN